MKRAVLDTNVFISGLINKDGPPGKILQAWRKSLFLLVISPSIIEEINQTLREKEFSRLGITEEDIRSLAFALVVNAD